MKVMFWLGALSALLLSVMFNSSVFADDMKPSASELVQQVQTVSDNTSYILASLQDGKSNLRHMVEEPPLCEGMAPPKSQAADQSVRNCLSSSVMRTSETSKTSINQQ